MMCPRPAIVLDDYGQFQEFQFNDQSINVDLGDASEVITRVALEARTSLDDEIQRSEYVKENILTWVSDTYGISLTTSALAVFIEAVQTGWEEFKKKSADALRSHFSTGSTPRVSPNPSSAPTSKNSPASRRSGNSPIAGPEVT